MAKRGRAVHLASGLPTLKKLKNTFPIGKVKKNKKIKEPWEEI